MRFSGMEELIARIKSDVGISKALSWVWRLIELRFPLEPDITKWSRDGMFW